MRYQVAEGFNSNFVVVDTADPDLNGYIQIVAVCTTRVFAIQIADALNAA